MHALLKRILVPIVFLAPIQSVANDDAIISAGLGDSMLPRIASFVFCRGNALAEGFGGMPVVFDQQIDTVGGYMGDQNGLDPSLFEVTVGLQERVVRPVCATLAPAVDATERRTVLLIGDFGLGGDNGPVAIQVVGDLMTLNGASLLGAKTDTVGEVNNGPSLVLAETFAMGAIATSRFGDGTLNRFCPAGETSRVVKLTFSGGVSGLNGARLADDEGAMAAIEILAVEATGRRVVLNPIALRDDDNDNHLDVCLGADAEGLQLIRAQVDSDTFYAPQNVPGPAITVTIQP